MHDEQRQKRLKTVELIVEEDDWEAPAGQGAADRVGQLRVPWSAGEVRQRVKGAGGRWDPASRLWALRYERVVALGLEDWLVEEGSAERVRPRG